MSHLSILPTVLRDLDCLSETLTGLGLQPVRGGSLRDFAGDSQPVALQVTLRSDQRLGWRRAADGSLSLVGDLQRISRSHRLQDLLGRITRAYAARIALREAAVSVAGGVIHLSA